MDNGSIVLKLAPDRVKSSETFRQNKNKMINEHEVKGDIPKMERKSTHFILKRERKTNVLGCMTYRCYSWLRGQSGDDHGWSAWFCRIELEKCSRLMYEAAQTLHHTLHMSRHKEFPIITSDQLKFRCYPTLIHEWNEVLEMRSGKNTGEKN